MAAKDLKDFINAIGAMGEMSGALRDSLLHAGFTREEAVSITKEVLIKSMTFGGTSDRGKDSQG